MARSFRTLAAAGAMALVLSACGVNQSEPPVVEAPKSQCQIDAEQFRDAVLSQPGIVYLETLRGQGLRKILESLGIPFGAGDQMVVVTHPEADHHYGLLMMDGCIVGQGPLPKADYDKMKRGASI